MKILPAMANAIPFLLEDGRTIERVAFQVFRTQRGFEIRLGRNVICFSEAGEFVGTEHKFSGSREEAKALEAALEASVVGAPPAEPYYQPGSKGHANETRDWPAAEPVAHPGSIYAVDPRQGKLN